MEELTIPLNQKFTFGSRLFVNIQITCAIVFIVQGFIYSGVSIWFTRFAVAYGSLLLLAMIVLPRLHREYSIQIDDDGIRGTMGYTKRIDLRWEDIVHADIMMFALILKTKGGETIHIDLGNLTYDQHKLVKPRLIDILGSRRLLKEGKEPTTHLARE